MLIVCFLFSNQLKDFVFELNDEPQTDIQHQEPLIIEISHCIVQTTSGKNNYCSLFILLLLSLFAQIPNGQKMFIFLSI